MNLWLELLLPFVLFIFAGPTIHQQLQELGGLDNITATPPGWPVSDDTVMHIATGEALASGKTDKEAMLLEIAAKYKECMKDMEGRKPGPTSILGTDLLQPDKPGGYIIPFNPTGTGCGAAMRSMCIGLRYSTPEDLDDLIMYSIESGRMTHNHPTGYLGSLASALFTSYAAQLKP
ncbi:protein ADP-ribosylarginine hydrolase, partial [Lingula anatina]|uniref:Protein ADP-ribosylarginine hydrolase n=1 Tax=Lingula anatina TaxID=7574 RepID=A0A2R2MKQ1_LINAN